MIQIKSDEEIEIMAEGGRRLAKILEVLQRDVRAGVPTKFLDEMSRKLIREAGAQPAFLNYTPAGARRPFPAALCVSLNETVVHGVPSDYVIQRGDVVKLDIGLIYKDFYVDAALAVLIPPVSSLAEKLVRATQRALQEGIAAAWPGGTLGDIGWAIENFVNSQNFKVAGSLSGHGIGRELHEEPSVLNVGRPGKGEKLLPGMVVAIEPMVVTGSGKVRCLEDESFVTADGSLSAHFEHTVAITKKGPRVLTAL